MSTENKPFFARFLENQHTTKKDEQQVKTGLTAGWPTRTYKWPSDDDEP